MKAVRRCLLGAVVAWAGTFGGEAARAEAPPTPARVPAAEPSEREIDELVVRLGDADFKTREAATRQLKTIGKAALPALKAAAENAPDVETRTRAGALVRRLERGELPGGPLEDADGRLVGRDLRVSVDGATRTVEVQDGVRRVKIREGPGSIEMTVSAKEEGREVSETYRADSRAELRAEEPEAYKLFQRWAGGPGPGWTLRGNPRLQVHGGALVVPAVRAPADELQALADRLEEPMRKAELTVEQRKEIFSRVDKLMELRVAQGGAADADKDRLIKEFFDKSDELRKRLSELKLPDPGDALPPPSNTRLGIQFSRAPVDFGAAERVVVMKVVAGERGEKLGLREGDVMRKINGRAIAASDDVRPALMEAKGALVIEVERAGEAVVLKEKE